MMISTNNNAIVSVAVTTIILAPTKQNATNQKWGVCRIQYI